jgi:hypothetical protein
LNDSVDFIQVHALQQLIFWNVAPFKEVLGCPDVASLATTTNDFAKKYQRI